MLKLSGCLAVAAAVSVVSLAPATASAQCGDIATSALNIVTENLVTGNGAPFFTAAFRFAYDLETSDVRDLWDYYSPSSPTYYEHILNGQYFTATSTLVDANNDGIADNIAAGDILVINSSSVAPAYGGHTVVVVGDVKVLSSKQNPITLDTQWIVPIADQTGSTHGCLSVGGTNYNDSRGCSSYAAGAAPGTAYMRVYTNANGEATAYNWRVNGSHTSYYDQATRPFTFGRVTPCNP
ncbi:hypothetical protein [Chondromyces crocatus]|uniref:Secreted protein n=1 Tax=Chondromyces crocatus TaxID=52 RepID=A0A0K1ECV7_CHOCO|nr:hypothetical protein [Chondromyces crocatus]AKT38674.1 uncharacterized protein CMC5_028220 [Chondromyces crocatus]